MATVKTPPTSPLRDRLVAQSQDPGSIAMLQSGMVWPATTASSSSPFTSPLKLPKRENGRQPFPQIPRRTSNSYKHLRNNNLVSKSPFKSQISGPSTHPIPKQVSPMRRVSAEKRQRPISMHEQAENEKPLLHKRDRKQSNVFQGLLQREPVTKSPFRRTSSEKPVAPAVASTRRVPVPSFTPNRLPTPASSSGRNSGSPSPQRPSLVSKRLHGPRLSGSGKRERRKTVTWDERCDVIEIDRRSELSVDVFASDSEQEETSESMDVETDDGDDFFQKPRNHSDDGDNSYESDNELRLDGDVSITGMVDSMLKSNGADRHTTPPPKSGDKFPADMEVEDGVPLGRSHHKDRLQEFHEQRLGQYPVESSPRPLPSPFRSSVTPTPSTPPLNISRPSISTPPLGRSTHIERVMAARRDQEEQEEVVDQLPGSPSPMKAKRPSQSQEECALVPAFELSRESVGSGRRSDVEDPFDLSDDDGPPGADASFASMSDTSRRNSNANRSGILDEHEDGPDVSFSSLHTIDTTVNHSMHDIASPHSTSHDSPRVRETSRPPSALDMFNRRANPPSISNSPRGGSPLPAIPLQPVGSSPRPPLPHAGSVSPLLRSSTSSPNLRPHISREDIQKRLMRQKSQDDDLDQLDAPEKDKVYLAVNPNDTILDETSMCTDDANRAVAEIEAATIQTAERMNIGAVATATATPPITATSLPTVEVAPPEVERRVEEPAPKQEAFNGLMVDFGGQFGLKGMGIAGLGSRSTRGSFDSGTVRVGDVDVDMEMRSALDRLMEDVASTNAEPVQHQGNWRSSIEVSSAFKSSPVSRNPSEASTLPPAEIRKPEDKSNNIKRRQEMILAKRREARGLDDSDTDHLKLSGPPVRRRSMSTSDADALKRRQAASGVLNVPLPKDPDALHESITRELAKAKEASKPTKYQIREREGMIYASSDADRVSHMDRVGDVNNGKAWRAVKRPSDMNEYSQQIKEYRATEKAKSHGKVFVRVLGIKNVDVPIPHQTTAMSITLNNGIHFVTTPDCRLGREAAVEQEFELIEHSKLEFTLTVKVRRDPHIAALLKSQASGPAPPPPVPMPIVQQTPSTRSGGMRSFFSSSPKKAKEKIAAIPVAPPPVPHRQQLHENITRYMLPDGTLARAFVAFKDIAHRCDTRLFETTFPLIGQRLELGSKTTSVQVGEIILQFFRLPPLPGLPEDQLPQSLEDCHRGLRHVNWHKVTYFEGILTQYGGDCMSWRRRQFRIVGGNLIAFNDVTKRATATIDLKKALTVEDDQAHGSNPTPSSSKTSSTRRTDEYDFLYGVERSFRLTFPHDEDIIFFADSDEEKSKWLDVLHALIGHIPPNPLWAELLWQRQEELNKRDQHLRAAGPSSRRPAQPTHHGSARGHSQ